MDKIEGGKQMRVDEIQRIEHLIALMIEGTILSKQKAELELLLAKEQGRRK